MISDLIFCFYLELHTNTISPQITSEAEWREGQFFVFWSFVESETFCQWPQITNTVNSKSLHLPREWHLSKRKTLTPLVKMQKYMQLTFLKLVVELILRRYSVVYCNYSRGIKRAYGFHGTLSKFHCFSSIPLIPAYNVYSQVNWTGTSLWVWRSLLRGSKAMFLPKHAHL